VFCVITIVSLFQGFQPLVQSVHQSIWDAQTNF